MGRRLYASCSKDTARVLPSAEKKRACKALEAASQYLSKSKHPSYAIVMRPSYLRHGYLHVPSTFVQEMHAKPGANNIKLEFPGKEYEAVFYNMGRFSRISKGWSTSVRESSLEVGDVCAMELINKEDGVISVTIFKSTI